MLQQGTTTGISYRLSIITDKGMLVSDHSNILRPSKHMLIVHTRRFSRGPTPPAFVKFMYNACSRLRKLRQNLVSAIETVFYRIWFPMQRQVKQTFVTSQRGSRSQWLPNTNTKRCMFIYAASDQLHGTIAVKPICVWYFFHRLHEKTTPINLR